jgi:hypothetical protein
MNKYFKNPYGGAEIPDFSTPDLSKYRFISTTAQGNRIYKRETPKRLNRKMLTKAPDVPNVLNKYERRLHKRAQAHLNHYLPF